MSRSPMQKSAALRGLVRSIASALAVGLIGAGGAFAQAPKSPVTINVVDVAGNLALTQDAFELYANKNPNMVAKFTFTKAPSPELPGKL